MINKSASSRVLAFTGVVVVIVACSSDTNNNSTGAGGNSGAGGATSAGAGGAGTAGSAVTAGTATTAGTAGMATTAGSGGMGGASSGAGGGGMGGASGGVGGGGMGGAGGKAGSGGGGSGGSAGSAGNAGSGGAPVVADCTVNAAGLGDGSILYERWDGVVGTVLIPLVYYAPVAATEELTEFRRPAQNLDDFQSRIRGFLTAPLNGTYRFWVSGDDQTELYLSTTELEADAVRIAWIDSWSDDQQWNKLATQKSADITLVQGTRYYVELRQKEGGGGDHMTVGWQLPGETGPVPCEIVPGSALSPFEPIGAGGAGGAGGEGNAGAGGAP